jgi:HPt (histidine-containing phosphotransfer) domain-containing protein
MLCRYLPKDKIIRPREPGWVEFCSAAPESQPVQPGLCLDSLGIDVTQAVRNCGGRDMFVSVAREFHRNIEKNAAVIEQFVQKKDIRNYTIQIHALKSSARLIGAGALSEYAAHLEEFGNAGDFKAIQAETPRLLEMYRSYESMVLPEESSDGNEAADKPVISNEELNEAIYGIKEFARVYDLASAGAIVNMLKNYRLPQSFVDTFNLIQDCILCSDQASLLSFLP